MTKDTEIDFAELRRRARDHESYDIELRETNAAGQHQVRVVQEPLDMLYARKTINDRQYNAGCALRDLYETANSSLAVQGYDGTSIDSIAYGPKPGLPQAVMDAWAGFSFIVSKLPNRVRIPLIIVCCYGEPIATAYTVKPRTDKHVQAIGQFQLALDLLADII